MQAISAPQRATSGDLASDLACALDPVVFAQRAGIAPDAWQRDVLRDGGARMLLNCSRQSGKTTICAILGLHRAIYNPGSLVLILSPSLRQSAEFFRVLVGLYNATGATAPLKAESQLRLELENGSRVISLPATEATIRGFSAVDLLLIDEAARVPDELYSAVRPMLAISAGRLIALSTPWGKRGWWSEAWHSPDPWVRVLVPAGQCPRIPTEFLAEERRTLGEWWFSQEYECTFADSDTSVFRTDDIDRAFKEVTQWPL